VPEAHGLQWDSVRNVPWVLGADRLVALEVTGTPADPRLVPALPVSLPGPDGHDLSAMAADPDRV